MSFLLDTDICSAHIKRPRGLAHRFAQHSGNLFVSTIVLGKLYAWAHFRRSSRKLLQAIEDYVLADTHVLDFDQRCAEMFGSLRGLLQRKGITIGGLDVLIAAVALVHNLTLVTHNTADFQNIPNLRLDDWLVP